MKNNFICKFVVEGIKKDLEKETKQKFYNPCKKYINKNTNYIFEICKKIAYKKIQKNVSFISKNQIKKYYDNTSIENDFYFLENEQKICKHEKNVNRFLFDILNNSKRSFKRYKTLENISNKKECKILYNKYIAKSTSTSKKIYNHNGEYLKTETQTNYNHDNNGAIENFEDITQTTFLALYENTKNIFVTKENKLYITKKAYYEILRNIDKLIKKTQKENSQASYEDLQERRQLDFLLFKNTSTENTENTNKKIIIDILQKVDFTPKQKQILYIIYKTNMNDKDIYNNLNITKQAFYKHLRKAKNKIIEHIQKNNLQNIYTLA